MPIDLIPLTRDVEAIEIPAGVRRTLPAATTVRISQFLGNAYTVVSDLGYLCRIDAKDADAIGLTPPPQEEQQAATGTFSDELVWEQLRTVFDPEIPVNV